MGFMKIFTVFGIVGKWFDKAMADGEVTLAEGLDLLIQLAGVFDLKLSSEVMAVVTSTSDAVLDAVGDAVETVEDAVDILKDAPVDFSNPLPGNGIEADILAPTDND